MICTFLLNVSITDMFCMYRWSRFGPFVPQKTFLVNHKSSWFILADLNWLTPLYHPRFPPCCSPLCPPRNNLVTSIQHIMEHIDCQQIKSEEILMVSKSECMHTDVSIFYCMSDHLVVSIRQPTRQLSSASMLLQQVKPSRKSWCKDCGGFPTFSFNSHLKVLFLRASSM